MYDPGGGYTRLNAISPAENFKGFADGGMAQSNAGGGMFNYAQMQPAVDLHSNSGVSPQNMASGGVAHFDDGGNVNSTYSPDVINNYIAQNNLSGADLTAAEQQFGVTPAQVAYAQAQAAPAASTPALLGLQSLDKSMDAATPAQAGQIAINNAANNASALLLPLPPLLPHIQVIPLTKFRSMYNKAVLI